MCDDMQRSCHIMLEVAVDDVVLFVVVVDNGVVVTRVFFAVVVGRILVIITVVVVFVVIAIHVTSVMIIIIVVVVVNITIVMINITADDAGMVSAAPFQRRLPRFDVVFLDDLLLVDRGVVAAVKVIRGFVVVEIRSGLYATVGPVINNKVVVLVKLLFLLIVAVNVIAHRLLLLLLLFPLPFMVTFFVQHRHHCLRHRRDM